MFERSNLEALAAYKGEHPVVSLYLDLAPTLRGSPDALRTQLKPLLKTVADRAPEADIRAIEAFFEDEFDWTGRSVAAFSSAGGTFWQVEQFAVPMRSRAHVGPKPFIMPLANIFDDYGRYVVALADQQTMRLFYIHLGEIIAIENRQGEELKRLKAGGGAAGRGRGDDLSGYHEATVNRNLKDFADRLASFCAYQRAEHILLAGYEPALHQLHGLLAHPWNGQVESILSLPIRASDKEVLQASLEQMQAKLAERENRLVDQVITLAAKGANGVVGLERTQEAIDAGRVQTLILVHDALDPELADAATSQVMDFGGRVVFVEPGSPLAGHGGIGALLRY